MTDLITFACYGCCLDGNAPATPIVDEHRARAAFEMERMDQHAMASHSEAYFGGHPVRRCRAQEL